MLPLQEEIYIFTIIMITTRPILILKIAITYLPEIRDEILKVCKKRAFLRTYRGAGQRQLHVFAMRHHAGTLCSQRGERVSL